MSVSAQPAWLRRLTCPLLMAIVALAPAACGTEEDWPLGTGRGAVVDAVLIDSQTATAIDRQLRFISAPFRAEDDVDLYQLTYETIDVAGQPTHASGTLALPRNRAALAGIVSYQHGTVVRRQDVPSLGSQEVLVGVGFAAADGVMALLPDFLGLGVSEGFHPYLHAASQASATIDLLRAGRLFAARQGYVVADRIFLLGYSQGGHATMAAHRAIEAEHADEFTVVAAAPMAGPYDLSGTMLTHMIDDEAATPPNPYYLPYLLLAFNAVYDLFATPAELFVAPFDETVPPLFDGETRAATINAALPDLPVQIIEPHLLAAVRSDTAHPLRAALRANDVYDWTPRAPLRLYHCRGDQDVPVANTEVTLATLSARGADVAWIEPPEVSGGDHSTCALPSLFSARAWFLTL